MIRFFYLFKIDKNQKQADVRLEEGKLKELKADMIAAREKVHSKLNRSIEDWAIKKIASNLDAEIVIWSETNSQIKELQSIVETSAGSEVKNIEDNLKK